MENLFIKKIIINEVRSIKNFEILLSENTKKNLIITGKNGCGKTSLLESLKFSLKHVISKKNNQLKDFHFALNQSVNRKAELIKNNIGNGNEINQIEDKIKFIEKQIKLLSRTSEIIFNTENFNIANQYDNGKFIVAFFSAKRNTSLKTPTGINKINTKSVYSIEENANNEFIQHIVNLKADKSFAKDDGETEVAKNIDQWFLSFEKSLKDLFNSEDLELKFDRKSYNFIIKEKGKEPYNLNELSDGYSSILSILTELIMRMETHKTKSYDVEGVVLIDEIETHLHIELQKKILPFLTSFFPKIQFIVSTHSPFVISSIENAVICDLEKRFTTTNLSGYSYDTIIESYYDLDKYSILLKDKIEEYDQLMSIEKLDEDQEESLDELKQYLDDIPKFISDELAVKIQQIKLKHLKPNKSI